MNARVHKKMPIVGGLARSVNRALQGMLARYRNPKPFPGSVEYWESRYRVGGNSGVGSYGFFREFKADVLNEFVATHAVQTIIEFGCGDGSQLELAKYPNYLGFDVSSTAVSNCQELFHGIILLIQRPC